MSGRLLIIGTPIGNLDDLSPRAQRALASCDLLLCEDTRHTRKLLSHFAIDVDVTSFHEHNEAEKSGGIVARISSGATIGLVSDAGMPLISDPGFLLVRKVREEGLTVEVVPGPFAAVLALAASGIAPVPFTFFGFPPHRSGERLDFYRGIAAHRMTAIVYESPQRIVSSLTDAREALGEVEVSVGREMTKLHEEHLRGTITEVIDQLAGRSEVRGEITIVFGPPQEVSHGKVSVDDLLREFVALRKEGMRRNDAVRLLADRHGMNRNDLYRVLLEEK